jgi:hypothetical protein
VFALILLQLPKMVLESLVSMLFEACKNLVWGKRAAELRGPARSSAADKIPPDASWVQQPSAQELVEHGGATVVRRSARSSRAGARVQQYLAALMRLRAIVLGLAQSIVQRRLTRQELADASASKIAAFAVLLAGRRHAESREEWDSHLAGGIGYELSAGQKIRDAFGFVRAAVLYRLRAMTDLAWVPAEAVLKSRTLSNLVVWMPTMAVAVILFRHDGFDGMIGDAEAIAATCAGFFALIKTGRWWRGVKPAEPKTRTERE